MVGLVFVKEVTVTVQDLVEIDVDRDLAHLATEMEEGISKYV